MALLSTWPLPTAVDVTLFTKTRFRRIIVLISKCSQPEIASVIIEKYSN